MTHPQKSEPCNAYIDKKIMFLFQFQVYVHIALETFDLKQVEIFVPY